MSASEADVTDQHMQFPSFDKLLFKAVKTHNNGERQTYTQHRVNSLRSKCTEGFQVHGGLIHTHPNKSKVTKPLIQFALILLFATNSMLLKCPGSDMT